MSDDARSGRSTGAPALPPFAPTFEALVAKVGGATPPEEVVALHERFEERTGAFGPDDPWFESRSRAFWDDTMTREAGRAWHVRALALDGGESAWAEALSRSPQLPLTPTRVPRASLRPHSALWPTSHSAEITRHAPPPVVSSNWRWRPCAAMALRRPSPRRGVWLCDQ